MYTFWSIRLFPQGVLPGEAANLVGLHDPHDPHDERAWRRARGSRGGYRKDLGDVGRASDRRKDCVAFSFFLRALSRGD